MYFIGHFLPCIFHRSCLFHERLDAFPKTCCIADTWALPFLTSGRKSPWNKRIIYDDAPLAIMARQLRWLGYKQKLSRQLSTFRLVGKLFLVRDGDFDLISRLKIFTPRIIALWVPANDSIWYWELNMFDFDSYSNSKLTALPFHKTSNESNAI